MVKEGKGGHTGSCLYGTGVLRGPVLLQRGHVSPWRNGGVSAQSKYKIFGPWLASEARIIRKNLAAFVL